MINKPEKIIVHHSAFLQDREQLAQINQWHKEREFPQSRSGYYVGYHYLISRGGIVTRTKDDDEEGAHTRGENFSSLGVCMEGHFNQQTPTAIQEQILGKLLVELCEVHRLPYIAIYPHRRFSNTACYGNKLNANYAVIVCLKEKISQLTAELHKMLAL